MTASSSSLDPLHQNLLGAVATIVYVKVVVGVCDFAVARQWIPSKVSRKVIHVCAGSWVVFWPLFSTDHWTWMLNVIVPVIYTVQLFVKGAIIRNRDDPDIRSMTRTGDPTELLYGPIFFTLVMTTVGLCYFRQELGILIMSCLGFGDGVAPLTAHYFPFGFYPTYPFGPNDKKTLSGSLGFFLASILGYVIFSYAILNGPVNFGLILKMASIGAITEGIFGVYDNVAVPLVVYFVYDICM